LTIETTTETTETNTTQTIVHPIWEIIFYLIGGGFLSEDEAIAFAIVSIVATVAVCFALFVAYRKKDDD
jgi:hypothetical protein